VQRREIAPDQRLFLLASPTFDLSLGGHGILDAFEILMEDEGHRPTSGSIAIECAGLMFGETLLQAATRHANVVRAISAAQDVQTSVHFAGLSRRPSFETANRGNPLDITDSRSG
jgi:hypothetical protein